MNEELRLKLQQQADDERQAEAEEDDDDGYDEDCSECRRLGERSEGKVDLDSRLCRKHRGANGPA